MSICALRNRKVNKLVDETGITDVEAKVQIATEDGMASSYMDAVVKVQLDAEDKGFGIGRPGNGKIDCPVCGHGSIHYSVSGNTGLVHAFCSSDKGCVRWME